MSTLGRAVTTRLEAEVAPAGGVHSMRAPEDTNPEYLVYEFSTPETRPQAMGRESGVVGSRIIVTAYGDTPTAARSLATQVHAAMSRWTRTADADGPTVQDTLPESYFEGEDPTTRTFYVERDYTIWWRDD